MTCLSHKQIAEYYSWQLSRLQYASYTVYVQYISRFFSVYLAILSITRSGHLHRTATPYQSFTTYTYHSPLSVHKVNIHRLNCQVSYFCRTTLSNGKSKRIPFKIRLTAYPLITAQKVILFCIFYQKWQQKIGDRHDCTDPRMLVENTGLEPVTPCTSSKCSSQLS